jgi:chromosome condensin MukBEF MukE localization factor
LLTQGTGTLNLTKLSDLRVRLPLYARWNVGTVDGYTSLDINVSDIPNGFFEYRFLNQMESLYKRYRVEKLHFTMDLYNVSPKPILVYTLKDGNSSVLVPSLNSLP